MSKLVIQTQYRENYAWREDGSLGTGADAYWKFKGGDTYVVNNLTSSHINKIAQEGIPTLTKLIEFSNDAFQEYILGWEIMDDDAKVCEDWETPTEYVWGGDRWLCEKITKNDEYGYMRSDIVTKVESWIPQEAGERAHYDCHFEMVNGELLKYNELKEVA